jgi:hypothetical protein
MKNATIVSAVAIAAAIVSACGDMDARMSATAPSPTTVELATLRVDPQQVEPGTLVSTMSFCPAVSPFTVPVNLIVFANGPDPIFVTQVTMQFVDVFGVHMPQVTLPAPQLTTQFGSALVAARSSRTFPLRMDIGCGTDRRGTVTVVVDTADSSGRRSTGQVRVVVH